MSATEDDTSCGNLVCEVIGGVGDTVAGTISYWSDPWGNTFKALQDAASSMSSDILPALTEATSPDYSAEWFINAYKISFAAAIMVAVIVLIIQFVRTARGQQSGRTLVDSVGTYFGLFLLGGMFGPLVGMMLVEFFHSLSGVFINFGISGTIDTTVAEFQGMIEDADPAGITGGLPIAVILMLLMIVGLFMVLLILLVRLVTLYFAGTVFPLGLVWILDPTKRQYGYKIGWLILGLLAAEPLLWLLLGIAFSLLANSVDTFGNPSLSNLVTLLVALIAIFGASLSPLLLMRFAPVLPMSSGGAAGPGVSNNPIGPKSVSEATEQYGIRDTSGSGTPVAASAEADAPSLAELGAASSEPAAVGVGARAAAAGAGGAATAGAATAGTAEVAGAGLAAAGVAETASGVGAAVGIPTLIVAGGVAAASAGFDVLQQANEQAAEAMEEPQVMPERTE